MQRYLTWLVAIVGMALLTGCPPESKTRPTALIYQGMGACPEGCAENASKVADMAGFQPVVIGPQQVDLSVFATASVYIQPGGDAEDAVKAMSPQLIQEIQKFVSGGGGYVGFCAGAYLVATQIDGTMTPGLGIFPAAVKAYRTDLGKTPAIFPIHWGTFVRQMYFEEGGSIEIDPKDASKVEVMARYEDGPVAVARSVYGQGKVYISNVHPEAPQQWLDAAKLNDPDGPDADLAVEMIRWAARVKTDSKIDQ